ncbi:hypothetical protein ACJMK2_027627 [Sinanodonta woodiana]|uniref:EF-hand domain-containing protein n=1 Tax=Sinanodonta woodiana TaxID=1069815 RepID=A0ABD3X8D8_SINWO
MLNLHKCSKIQNGSSEAFVGISETKKTRFQRPRPHTVTPTVSGGMDLSGKNAKKVKNRVSFVSSDPVVLGKDEKQENHLEVIKLELERYKVQDDEKDEMERMQRLREISKVREKLGQLKREKGIQIRPDAEKGKKALIQIMEKEEREATDEEKNNIRKEKAKLQECIDEKYGSKITRETPHLIELAEEFISPKKISNEFDLPDKIITQLTTQEIRDLKTVFDMFDIRGKGYIKAKDVRQLAAMLGFRAKKEIFQEMIDEIATDHKGRVTFVNFLDFIITSQSDGPDPKDEIEQCFKMLDDDGKGYLKFEDLRKAADELDVNLSNRAIQEMLEEADTSGNGEISVDEFVQIIMQTTTYRMMQLLG